MPIEDIMHFKQAVIFASAAARYGEWMAERADTHAPVRIEPGGDMWGRLRHWLHESITAIEIGDVSRLPETLTRDGGTTARDTYETVLMAMEILETGLLAAPAAEHGSTTP